LPASIYKAHLPPKTTTDQVMFALQTPTLNGVIIFKVVSAITSGRSISALDITAVYFSVWLYR